MTLRHLLTAAALSAIARERQLKAIDVRVYVHLLFSPLQPITEHARLLSFSRETFRRSVVRLINVGWAYAHLKPGRSRGAVIIPWVPEAVEHEVVARLAVLRNDTFPYGEWLMKCWLDLLVHDGDFQDNARPEWLITPSDGRRLEQDRWYRTANVAFEFQGRQHFQTGDRFVTSGAQLSQRMHDDVLKARPCAINGVHLIELTSEDLEHERLREVLHGKLPLVPVRERGPLFRELTGMSRSYRKSTQDSSVTAAT